MNDPSLVVDITQLVGSGFLAISRYCVGSISFKAGHQ